MIINPKPENQCYKMMLKLRLNIALVFGKISQVVDFVFSKNCKKWILSLGSLISKIEKNL
jgi:hypothetical protein